MKTKNSALLPSLILVIIAVVFNVLVFLISDERNGTFWSGYAFTMVAMVLQVALSWLVFAQKAENKKVFLGLPVLRFGVLYLIIQIIVGTVFMVSQVVDIKIALSVQIVLLAICLVLCIVALTARDYATDVAAKIAPKTFYIKSLLVDVQMMQDRTADPMLKKALYNLAETIQYSDPMSHESLFALEQKIESKTAYLSQLVAYGSIGEALSVVQEVTDLFIERNRKTKILK